MGKLFKGYQVVLVQFRLHDGSFSDRYKLFGADLVITVKVVHAEGKMKFFHARIDFIQISIFLDRPKVSQNSHEVLEVHLVVIPILTLVKESVYNPIPKRIYCQLRNSKEVLS